MVEKVYNCMYTYIGIHAILGIHVYTFLGIHGITILYIHVLPFFVYTYIQK